MFELELNDVTLVCVDGSVNKDSAEKTVDLVSKRIKFSEVYFNNTISTLEDYNDFIINKLHDHVNSNYCLIIQYDGYPINLSAWTDEFLSYDYIGAPWYQQPWPLEQTVGNGGFSLRSKKFLVESSKLGYERDSGIPEDVYLCRQKDKVLKSVGIVFAPHDVAYRFSVEDMPYKEQFGFHGKVTIQLNKQLGIFR